MLIKLNRGLLMLVCAALVVQWAGCVYDRHGRRSGDDRQRRHDRAPERLDLDVRLH